MSVIVAPIRDAVVKAINDAGLTPSIEAEAVYDVTATLGDLAGGMIAVCPQTKDPTLITRGKGQKVEVKIDVAVLYKFTTTKTDELDPYLALAEKIVDLLIGKVFKVTTESIVVTCMAGEFPKGLFDQEQILKEFRVFCSPMTFTFAFTS